MKRSMNVVMAIALLCVLAMSSCTPKTSKEEIAEPVLADTIQVVEPETETVEVVEEVEVKKLRTPLTVVISNLESATAPVSIAIYNAKNKFPDKEGRIQEYMFTPDGKTLTAEIKDRAYGEYAIAIYQDVNSDGKYNKNFLGLPVEPYGFSNNFKPKVKAPGFSDCKFTYDAVKHNISIAMIR